MSSERSSSSLEWSSIAISSESLKWECGENSPSLRGDSFLPAARLEDGGDGERIASSTMAENEASSKEERKGIPPMLLEPEPDPGATAVLQVVGDGDARSCVPSNPTAGESIMSHFGELLLLLLFEASLLLQEEDEEEVDEEETGPWSRSASALM